MKLVQEPQPIVWPETHYIFIEEIGPFQETAQRCWMNLHKAVPEISKSNNITGFCALYKVDPKKMVYRAGVKITEPAKNLPPGCQYVRFNGGKYVRFTLTGSYSQLPEASGKVFDAVAAQKLPRRDDFNIENYVNDPKTTPEDQLLTEILIPTT